MGGQIQGAQEMQATLLVDAETLAGWPAHEQGSKAVSPPDCAQHVPHGVVQLTLLDWTCRLLESDALGWMLRHYKVLLLPLSWTSGFKNHRV